MPRKSTVVADVSDRLERYLEKISADYYAQPESSRKPTLPYTKDFKANVTRICEELDPPLELSKRTYLHRYEELADMVDLVAEAQGLMTIGGRLHQDRADRAVQARLIEQAARAKEDAQAATEANARAESLIEELQQAHARIAELEAEVTRLRAQYELIESGLMVSVQ